MESYSAMYIGLHEQRKLPVDVTDTEPFAAQRRRVTI